MYKKSFTNDIILKIKAYMRAPSAYRVFILSGASISGKTKIAKEIRKELDGEYIDLVKDKLNVISARLGRYSPLDFKHDINLWAKETESLLVVDEIEALLDTWTRKKQEDLFKLLSTLRTDSVVLIVTRLNLRYEDIMGKDRVFRVA